MGKELLPNTFQAAVYVEPQDKTQALPQPTRILRFW